jgi:hypothetical protein
MPSASAIRLQIESALAHRIPSALTPIARSIRPVSPTGVSAVDELLDGGLPLGAISEFAGPESSGRSALALSFVARMTNRGSVAAWVDASDTLDPESAAAAGVDLDRVLWVRCGVTAAKPRAAAPYRFALPDKYMVPAPAIKGLYGGGCGGHPRGEVKGLAAAVSGFLVPEAIALRDDELERRAKNERAAAAPPAPPALQAKSSAGVRGARPWSRIEQALRVTDLLLQAGGFSAIVLDFGSIAPEFAARVPLATWFRYRAAAERTQASLLLLTQYGCAKSSAELLLRFKPACARQDEATIFSGMECSVDVDRRNFAQAATNVIPMRKPPQRETGAGWRSQAAWAGAR